LNANPESFSASNLVRLCFYHAEFLTTD
jgi:hypothetical protein